jgi:Kef-type K+ transport system membrane component KefB
MSVYPILIILSSLIILSYLFNLISQYLRLPAVLLLIAAGIGLKELAAYAHFEVPGTQTLVELLGITGLILIVLEGSLDLKLNRKVIPLVGRSLLSAALILFATTAAIAFVLHELMLPDWRTAIVYAVPLGVISSAIAIPSVSRLTSEKREFIIYESTFSDIIGIMLFNHVILENWNSWSSLPVFLGGFFGIIATAIISTLLLLLLLHYSKSHVRFFLVFAFLILIYSVAKLMHWPSLLLILIFGLALNNPELFIKGKLKKYFYLDKLGTVTQELKLLTAESAFLIRTFFFLLFGFSIQLAKLNDTSVLIAGSSVTIAILLVRLVFLRFISKVNVFPELFIAPRGLITIILFYSIPAALQSPLFNDGVLLFVILASNVLMMAGLLIAGKKYSSEMDQIV